MSRMSLADVGRISGRRGRAKRAGADSAPICQRPLVASPTPRLGRRGTEALLAVAGRTPYEPLTKKTLFADICRCATLRGDRQGEIRRGWRRQRRGKQARAPGLVVTPDARQLQRWNGLKALKPVRSDRDVQPRRGEGARHVGRGPFPTKDDVGVAHILEEQRLSTGTTEVARPWRVHRDRPSRLAISQLRFC